MATPARSSKDVEKNSKQLQIDWAAIVADKAHKVTNTVAQFGTPARLKAAQRRRPCAEVAAIRIRQYFLDLGKELGYDKWMAQVARESGMTYSTCREIIHGRKTRVGPNVVDQIAKATGCPVAVFYDEEF
jgi:Helix-turn-helix